MLRFAVLSVAILTSSMWTFAIAGTGAIGTASARGSMRIDGAVVNGNATLFDGTVVETGEATTALRLERGVEVKLAADSRGTLYRDRLVLEKGSGELVRASGFELETSHVRITPDTPNARGVVSMSLADSVRVEALSGALRVTTGNGILLAKLEPGRAMDFTDAQSGAAAPTSITGSLTKEADACTPAGEQKYFVTVAATGAKYEVSGEGLDKFVGKTVTLVGTLDPSFAPSNCAAGLIVGATVPSGTGAAATGQADRAAGAAGMAASTKLIIAGVAVAAAAGTGVGLYEANQSSTPASR
jgi:hypothetical protein